ncbi:MAG: hemin uptake protein HemP [Rhodocyclaceae bacterium]|jgi:hemin uptake protein HemP|nr:hemin uptake protein HemP [Rhodocyclaceae bacterium]
MVKSRTTTTDEGSPPARSANGEIRPAASPLSSAEVLRGRREARIEHRGEIYCLRETKNGKLILTK